MYFIFFLLLFCIGIKQSIWVSSSTLFLNYGIYVFARPEVFHFLHVIWHLLLSFTTFLLLVLAEIARSKNEIVKLHTIILSSSLPFELISSMHDKDVDKANPFFHYQSLIIMLSESEDVQRDNYWWCCRKEMELVFFIDSDKE